MTFIYECDICGARIEDVTGELLHWSRDFNGIGDFKDKSDPDIHLCDKCYLDVKMYIKERREDSQNQTRYIIQ